ncbi:hypothetical protein DFP73DRAFT_534600, partial [Morchella snyderi]
MFMNDDVLRVGVGWFFGEFSFIFMPFCFFPSTSHSRHVLFAKAFFFFISLFLSRSI